ncbi:hypothetical protein Btru_067472 [Bulinus truncatus]|nr:hypothetical protein Btru_067472 [Bulinus truncatus]
MSVWSRSHADLALLVKTMQARNISTRQKLDSQRGTKHPWSAGDTVISSSESHVGLGNCGAVNRSPDSHVKVSTIEADISSPESHVEVSTGGGFISSTIVVSDGCISGLVCFDEHPDDQGRYGESLSTLGFAGSHTLDTIREDDEVVILHDQPVGRLSGGVTFQEDEKVIIQGNITLAKSKEREMINEEEKLSHIENNVSTLQAELVRQMRESVCHFKGMQDIVTHSEDKDTINNSLIDYNHFPDTICKLEESEESTDANSESHQRIKYQTSDPCTLLQNLVSLDTMNSLVSTFPSSQRELSACVSQCDDTRLNDVCTEVFIFDGWTTDGAASVQCQDGLPSHCDGHSLNLASFSKEENLIKYEPTHIYSDAEFSATSDVTDSFTKSDSVLSVNCKHTSHGYGVSLVSGLNGKLLPGVFNESHCLLHSTPKLTVDNISGPTGMDNTSGQDRLNGEMSDQSFCSLNITSCETASDVGSRLSFSASLPPVLTEESHHNLSKSGTLSCHRDMSSCNDEAVVSTALAEHCLETPLVESLPTRYALNVAFSVSEQAVNLLPNVVTEPLHSSCRTYHCESFTEAESLERIACDLNIHTNLNATSGRLGSSDGDRFWSDASYTPLRGQPCETLLTFSTGIRVSSKVEQPIHYRMLSREGIYICPAELPLSFNIPFTGNVQSESVPEVLETSRGNLLTCVHGISGFSEDGQSKCTVSETKRTPACVAICNQDVTVESLCGFNSGSTVIDVSLTSLLSENIDNGTSVKCENVVNLSYDTGHANSNDACDSHRGLSMPGSCQRDDTDGTVRTATNVESSEPCRENFNNHLAPASVTYCCNESPRQKGGSNRDCHTVTRSDSDEVFHEDNNGPRDILKPHSPEHCNGATVTLTTYPEETGPAEASHITAAADGTVLSEVSTQYIDAEEKSGRSDLGYSNYNESVPNNNLNSEILSDDYTLHRVLHFKRMGFPDGDKTVNVSPIGHTLKYSSDEESILVKAKSDSCMKQHEFRETSSSSDRNVYPVNESYHSRNHCFPSDVKLLESEPVVMRDRQELCNSSKSVPMYLLLEGGLDERNGELAVSETDGTKLLSEESTDVASQRMLDLISTLRILRDKIKDGHSFTQCAALLRRLESSKQFFMLNQTPSFVSIRNDLKQVCQALTKRIETSRQTSAAFRKKIMNHRPSVRKMSTQQQERCRKSTKLSRNDGYSHCLKPKSYEIDRVTQNKTRRLHGECTKSKKSHRYKTSVNSDLVITEDGSCVDSLRHAAADRLNLKHNTDQAVVRSCYAPHDSGHLEQSGSSESATISSSSSTITEGRKSAGMENESEMGYQLDREFDKYLADMKPHVLKLPQKTERQKSAVWIKKLCEPVKGGVAARKTRNMYAQLLLEMLKKDGLDNPFDQKPESGALKPLPSYLIERLPDWVEGELADTVGSSLFTKSLGIPAATSTWVSNTAEYLERPHSSMGHTLEKDPSLSPIRHTTDFSHPRYSADDMSIELQRSPTTSRRHRKVHHLPSGDREKRLLPDVNVKENRENDKLKEVTINDADWTKPYSSTTSSTYSLPKGTTFYDDPNFLKPADRELAMRAKMIEAKFHEEKLKLQQKHDAAVQKILDRKNAEIEDLKNLYRAKSKDMEDTINKLERKVQTLLKETEFIRQSKDKQIVELKKLAEDSNENRKSEYEKKLHELITEFEQEKFELQKQHTQNIQEILDDTNDRLQRMESEYTNQTNITTDVIKDLESRVQQLMNEVDTSLSQRSAVEKEKNDVWMKYEKICSENERLRERLALQEREQQKVIESHEHELRSLKNKTEASLEYLKQEHSMATSKASDTIKDLEEKNDQLKKSLKENEEHRQRQIREMEQNHQQDKLHLENLHDKQIRNLKKELEQLDADWNKKVTKLEQMVKDKEQAMNKLKEQKHQQKLQAEQALEDFKSEVEKNQSKIYDEMKQQMQLVEIDLQKSKQAREKQAKEFAKQLENERYSHQHELAELKMSYEADKSQLIREFHTQKEFLLNEHERDVENLKDLHKTEILSLEARMKEKQDKAEKSAIDSERMIRELREELLQANQLRKQQLVELGLLREEEKQKMHRDHEAELVRVRAEMEQQKLGLQKAHSAEIENVLEKTNQRLGTLEKDFTNRAAKSSETITELQAVIKQLREENQRSKESCEKKISDLKHSQEEEKRSLKKKFSHNIEALRSEVDSQKNRGNNAERRLQKAESDLEERLTELKIHYEEKIRGLVPLDVKKELEETIAALKSQVNSLQLRSALLQEELDSRSGLSSFGTLTNTVIKSAV